MLSSHPLVLSLRDAKKEQMLQIAASAMSPGMRMQITRPAALTVHDFLMFERMVS